MGQDAAKRALSVAVYNHYKRISLGQKAGDDDVELAKSNIMLLGPTGSGKTLLALSLIHIVAVQIGPTYGGGFKVCPGADPHDGLFDYCIAHPPIGPLKAAKVFLKAKEGRHTGYADVLSFGRAARLALSFDEEPPVQIDGEAAHGRRFEISMLPREIDVLFANEGACL